MDFAAIVHRPLRRTPRGAAGRRGALALGLGCTACPAWWSPPGGAGDPTTTGGLDITTASDATAPTDGAASTSGASSGTGASTGAGQERIEPWCHDLDPQQAYFVGTYINDTISTPPFARVGIQRSSCVGFDDSEPRTLRLRGDGRLLWMHSTETHGIHVYTPDPLTWTPGEGWSYPDDPRANDDLIPTTACTSGYTRQFLVHPGNGTVVYNCGGAEDDGANWYDQQGQLVYQMDSHDPIALAVDGTILTRDLWLAAPGGEPFAVTAPVPVPVYPSVHTARSWQDGLRAIVEPDDEAPLQLWSIAPDGSAQIVGEYVGGGVIQPPSPYPGQMVLAPDGAMIHIDTFSKIIYRRELAPGKLAVLYTIEDDPPTTWPLELEPYIYMVSTSVLFTGA